MPTIVGVLTFMRRINFVLSLVEYEKSFITSVPHILPDPTKIALKMMQLKHFNILFLTLDFYIYT